MIVRGAGESEQHRIAARIGRLSIASGYVVTGAAQFITQFRKTPDVPIVLDGGYRRLYQDFRHAAKDRAASRMDAQSVVAKRVE